MAKKRVTAILTLLLSLVLILPCFVGCGNAPQEKNNPSMVTYEYSHLWKNFIVIPLSHSHSVSFFECRI